MAYVATIVQPSGQTTTRTVPTAENGAFQLMMLLNMHGWTGDANETREKLMAGEPISFKGFTYSVTEEPGNGGTEEIP